MKTPLPPSDFIGRRILWADWCEQQVGPSGTFANVLLALHLDNGAIVNFDAVVSPAVPVPLVTFAVERPKRQRPRECHGCGRKLDRYLPAHVVFCGACGDAAGPVPLPLEETG